MKGVAVELAGVEWCEVGWGWWQVVVSVKLKEYTEYMDKETDAEQGQNTFIHLSKKLKLE